MDSACGIDDHEAALVSLRQHESFLFKGGLKARAAIGTVVTIAYEVPHFILVETKTTGLFLFRAGRSKFDRAFPLAGDLGKPEFNLQFARDLFQSLLEKRHVLRRHR